MIILLKRVFHRGRRALANFWLNSVHPKTTQIGITGSYGKTSTTYGIFNMLASFAPTMVTDLNLDTIYNVPITALKLRNHKFVIFELGIDQPNEMSFHLEIARPQIGIITGITSVHSDEKHLGSLEEIISEKRKLIEALPETGYAILNYDDPYVREMAKSTRATVLWYGTNASCHYRADQIDVSTHGTKFLAVTPKETFRIETPLLGRHSATNIMAAIAVGELANIPAAQMQSVFQTLLPLQGRLNIEPGPLGATLINDALRANPATTKAGLNFLGELNSPGKKIAILGEMGELGSSAVEKHTEIGVVAAQTDLSLLFCVGDLTKHTASAAIAHGLSPDKIFSVPNVSEAARLLKEKIEFGDTLYLKGSLLRHMERILLLLEGERVNCQVTSCHFYHQCTECPYVAIGYTEDNYQ